MPDVNKTVHRKAASEEGRVCRLSGLGWPGLMSVQRCRAPEQKRCPQQLAGRAGGCALQDDAPGAQPALRAGTPGAHAGHRSLFPKDGVHFTWARTSLWKSRSYHQARHLPERRIGLGNGSLRRAQRYYWQAAGTWDKLMTFPSFAPKHISSG